MEGKMADLKIIVLVALHVAVILGKYVTQTTGREETAMDVITGINIMEDNELAKNLLQVDVRETEEQIAIRKSSRKRRGAIKNSRSLWPDGIVYYQIEESQFDSKQLENIRDAINDIQSKTCIQFKKRNTGGHVRVYKGSGCWSYIGRTGGIQDLSLGGNCASNGKGVPTHEFIHAIGFFHEHARPDRDNYVNYHPGNVREGFQDQFGKRGDLIDSLGVDYDTDSVMHYGKYTFSTQYGVKATLTKKGDPDKELGGPRMTDNDAKQINLLYDCQIDDTTKPTEETTTIERTTTMKEITTTEATTTEKPNVCESLNNNYNEFNCNFWSYFGFCGRSSVYVGFMQANCARRCCQIDKSKK